ncbi:MAG: hypothetical protein M3P42_06185, partial [Actinomycetota bacterium]|nr:hypothetical protein [Actinomycetota bacterium]
MDLQLVGRVLWRFKMLVLAGFALALCLSFLAMMRVSSADGSPTFAYRDMEQWDSVSTLFVTSQKFPWGSVLPPQSQSVVPRTPEQQQQEGSTGVDPAHLTSLAGLYARLAVSDQVYRLMLRGGPLPGFVQAEPLAAGKDNSGSPLPMIGLSAVSTSAPAAHALAQRHVNAFVRYLELRQAEAQIPADERVVVEIASQPQKPVLIEPRKKTRPVIVFLAVMIAVIGLAFILENMRPRVRPIPAAQDLP